MNNGQELSAKKNISKPALGGFFLSLLSFAGLIGAAISFRWLWKNAKDASPSFLWVIIAFLALTAIGFIAGLICSVIGSADVRKHKKSGLVYAIIGILISSITAVVSIVVTFAVIMGISVMTSFLENVDLDSPWTSNEKSYEGYDVRLTLDEQEAAVIVCYWDGDPDNTVITLPDCTPDGAKITAVGGKDLSSLPPRFAIVPGSPEKNYCLTSSYKNALPDRFAKKEFVKSPAYYGIDLDAKVYFEEITFTLKIGKYVEDIYFQDYDHYVCLKNDDGSITVYYYHIVPEIDPANENLYSGFGKIYRRSNDSWLDPFAY